MAESQAERVKGEQEAAQEAERSAREQPESIYDIEDVLTHVQHFLRWISQPPMEDADKIDELVDEIRASDSAEAIRPRNEEPQMFTEDRMHEGSAILSAQQARSPELDELLSAVIDDPEIWLTTPSIQLGGRRPGELIGTAEEFKIFDILNAVDQGLF
jgi:hypothetical protein